MAKYKAPVTLTGGQGFNFEDAVGARAMLDMLGGAVPFGQTVGTIERIDWQARDAGHLLDDIALTLKHRDVIVTAEMSVKSDRQVTEGGFPSNFVEAAWEQWLHTESEIFQRDRDLLVLVTSKLANNVAEAWEKLIREALATTPSRMVARLQQPAEPDDGSHSSKVQRELFASLKCPERFRGQVHNEEQQRVDLLRRIRVLHLDFLAEPSKDNARALLDCRTLVTSGDDADAEALWESLTRIASEMRGAGGSIDLRGLLARLRDHHALCSHPDYRADWDAIQQWSEDILDGIATTVGAEITLERQDAVRQLSDSLATNRVCLAIGESGSGKSALAKTVAQRDYSSVAALPSEAFETGRSPAVDQYLGLKSPCSAVLSASGCDCLVIFDSIERFSDNGIRLVGRIIWQLLQDEQSRHLQFLLTAQFEAAERVGILLAEEGITRSIVAVHPIDCPDERDVRELLSNIPEVSWTRLHQDMRPLLRNLKILDWLVRASQGTGNFPASTVTGLIPLIDYLWGRWVEVGNSGVARSGLLKRLALAEGQTFSVGVPLMELSHPEQLSVTELVTSELLRVRNERIRFSHDLLGDWARLKILIGEDPTISSEMRVRSAAVRWHRAVRLYGRWLLSQPDGSNLWRAAIERADDGTQEGAILRDLLLEAVILSDESERLLREVWPILIANEGNYLNRLLDRFLFVATVPDSRIRSVAADERAAERLGLTWRVPFWPYWPAFLIVICENAEQIVDVAAPLAAKFCKLWLGSVPVEFLEGMSFPLRRQAANLAVMIARAAREESEHRYINGEAQKDAYAAVLLAAPDLPGEVSALALEVAERRPSAPTKSADQDAVNEDDLQSEAVGEPSDAGETDEEAAVCGPPFAGPLRAPWPIGPRARVDHAFSAAVLGGQEILALASVRPEAAIEVLLAVSIEEPQHLHYQRSDAFDDFGTVHWQDGYPPFYYRGPFLLLLRAFPQLGIEYVLQLVNFATDRWADRERFRAARQRETVPTNEELGVSVNLPSGDALWIGDAQVAGNFRLAFFDLPGFANGAGCLMNRMLSLTPETLATN